jgi:GMP synthase-like glutamine amidotransferase
MARALLIANDALDSGGHVEDELHQRGYRFDRLSRESTASWPELDGSELVLSLGSQWHVHDERVADAVEVQTALIRAAHERGVPVFGICYGAQILSHALGGTVRTADAFELGWLTIEPMDGAITAGPWFQWHADTFTLPPEVDLLARSAVGPQAFRAGRSFGVQFHLEVDVETVTSWVGSDGGRDLGRAGIDGDALIDQTRVETERSGPAARALVDWFCRSL